MLTIKHVEDGGRESVVTVTSVNFDPVRNELIGFTNAEPLRYTTGRNYVMNENGKTVGVYILTKVQPK